MPFKKTAKQHEANNVLANHLYSLLVGGSRSGKTLLIMRAMILRGLKAAGSRHVALRRHFNHAKTSLWHDSIPKILALCFPGLQYTQNKSDWFISLPNKSEIWLGGLDDKERTEKILGNEYATIFLNECSQIPYESYNIVKTRLAQNTSLKNRLYCDCNPPEKSHWTYQVFIKGVEPKSKIILPDIANYGHIFMNPGDNIANLPKNYLDILKSLPQRQRQRFLEGQFTDDVEGALWNYMMLDQARINLKDKEEDDKVVISIDPAVTKNKSSDETGIISVSKSKNFYYVLNDISGKYSPDQWAEKAINEYDRLSANYIVVEVNQGGDMVKSIIRSKRSDIMVKEVHATKGKYTRAEPIAALYEQGLVKHIRTFNVLEEQMLSYTPENTESPDRLDALVWGLTFLSKPRAALSVTML